VSGNDSIDDNSSQSHASVQLLETERLLLPVLGCGTVCQLTLFRVTRFLISVENLKHFCLGSPILLFCFSFSLWTL